MSATKAQPSPRRRSGGKATTPRASKPQADAAPSPDRQAVQRLYYSVSYLAAENARLRRELDTALADAGGAAARASSLEAVVRQVLCAIPRAEERIRSHFSYRLGRAIVGARSLMGALRLPATIMAERKAHRLHVQESGEAAAPDVIRSPGVYLLEQTRRLEIGAGAGFDARIRARLIMGDQAQAAALRVHRVTADDGKRKVQVNIDADGAFDIALSGQDGGLALLLSFPDAQPAVLELAEIAVSESRGGQAADA